MEKIFRTIFASAARTASVDSIDFMAPERQGALFLLSITAVTGTTPTLDLKVQCKDEISGSYIDLPGGSFAQKTGTGTDSLLIYPGIGETANRMESNVMPMIFRVVATIAGTTPSFTFSLSAQLIP